MEHSATSAEPWSLDAVLPVRNTWITLSGTGWDCWRVCAEPGVGLDDPCGPFQLRIFCDSTYNPSTHALVRQMSFVPTLKSKTAFLFIIIQLRNRNSRQKQLFIQPEDPAFQMRTSSSSESSKVPPLRPAHYRGFHLPKRAVRALSKLCKNSHLSGGSWASGIGGSFLGRALTYSWPIVPRNTHTMITAAAIVSSLGTGLSATSKELCWASLQRPWASQLLQSHLQVSLK